MQATYCVVMETTKLSWSVELHFVFLLWVIDFEKKLLTEHYMHIKDKIFISFFVHLSPFDVSRASAIWIGANFNISYFMVAFFFESDDI